jgi:3-oxoacyl-[acyl-carrier-protein] synthase II
VGSGVGGIWTYSQEFDTLREKGPRRVSPVLVPMITVDVPSVQITLRTGARGPTLGHAYAMFTGGFEAAVTPNSVATFDRMRALSRRNDDPLGISRPP